MKLLSLYYHIILVITLLNFYVNTLFTFPLLDVFPLKVYHQYRQINYTTKSLESQINTTALNVPFYVLLNFYETFGGYWQKTEEIIAH